MSATLLLAQLLGQRLERARRLEDHPGAGATGRGSGPPYQAHPRPARQELAQDEPGSENECDGDDGWASHGRLSGNPGHRAGHRAGGAPTDP